jgi:hypothetical protein
VFVVLVVPVIVAATNNSFDDCIHAKNQHVTCPVTFLLCHKQVQEVITELQAHLPDLLKCRRSGVAAALVAAAAGV